MWGICTKPQYAYYQATGKDKLLNVAIKSAKHVNKVFFEGGDPNYNGGKPINQAPGHEEIELALCKLYRVTNDPPIPRYGEEVSGDQGSDLSS